ncbi:hypothetical protein cypCar_00023251, partial [Cyprinus carpio]
DVVSSVQSELLFEVSVEVNLEAEHHEESSSLRSALETMFEKAAVGLQTHGDLQSSLQGLQGRTIKSLSTKTQGVIASVSTEEINECEAQMVVCDAHAECVNQFGSYSCHCIHGYREVPHGPGASVCMESTEP